MLLYFAFGFFTQNPIAFQDGISDVPVILVGNKTDQQGDRMVTIEEGQRRFREISCVSFHELSVREQPCRVRSASKIP